MLLHTESLLKYRYSQNFQTHINFYNTIKTLTIKETFGHPSRWLISTSHSGTRFQLRIQSYFKDWNNWNKSMFITEELKNNK